MWFDLSFYQGPIDFAKLSKIPGLEGCIIRVQAGYTHPDTRYKEYVAGCKQYGIPFGTYAAALPIDVNDAIKEADSSFNLMDKASVFFVVDAETQTCKVAQDYSAAVQAYVDRMHSHGVQKVGLYSYEGFYNSNGLSTVKRDFTWMAAYGTNDGQPHTPPIVPCDLWQYTSEFHADGITQNTVDVSKDMGTKPQGYFTGKPNPGLGTIEMSSNSVIRKEANVNSDIVGNTKVGDKWVVNQIQDGWYLIGNPGWVYKDNIKFDWKNVLVGGFTQFEIDSALDQLKKAFPTWHMEIK